MKKQPQDASDTPSKHISRSKKKNRSEAKPGGKFTPPDWFMAISPGSHGNTAHQKRLWRVVSEWVRERDFNLYGGKCVSCPLVLEHWKFGRAAHWKPWGACNSFFKYDLKNIALSCEGCNGPRAGGDTGFRFGEELKRRYGKDVLDYIESENQRWRGVKMEDWDIVAMAERLLTHVDKPLAAKHYETILRTVTN